MINFTGRDFSSIRQNLIELVPTLTDQWTDMSEHDLGMVWIELLAGVSAMLNFYIDKQHNESFIEYAQENKNIIGILGNLGYKKPLRKPPMAKCYISAPFNAEVDTRFPSTLLIDKYSTLKSKNGKVFICVEDITMLNTDTYVEFNVYDAQVKTLDVPFSKIKDYKIHLPKHHITDVGFVMKVAEVEWERVDNVFLDLEGGAKYSVHRDSNDNHYILLSHDYRKYIGSNNVVELTYLITEGKNDTYTGDIEGFTNSIMIDGVDYSDVLRVSNKESFTGGSNEPDLLLAKASVLRKLTKGNMLSTREDFEDYFKSIPNVFDVQCVDMSILGANVKPYEVISYIKLQDSDVLSSAFIENIQQDIKKNTHLSLSIQIKDPTIETFDLSCIIYAKYGTNTAILRSEVNTFLLNKFEKLTFTSSILREDITASLQANFPSISSVEYLNWEDRKPKIGTIYKLATLDILVEEV